MVTPCNATVRGLAGSCFSRRTGLGGASTAPSHAAVEARARIVWLPAAPHSSHSASLILGRGPSARFRQRFWCADVGNMSTASGIAAKPFQDGDTARSGFCMVADTPLFRSPAFCVGVGARKWLTTLSCKPSGSRPKTARSAHGSSIENPSRLRS